MSSIFLFPVTPRECIHRMLSGMQEFWQLTCPPQVLVEWKFGSFFFKKNSDYLLGNAYGEC